MVVAGLEPRHEVRDRDRVYLCFAPGLVNKEPVIGKVKSIVYTIKLACVVSFILIATDSTPLVRESNPHSGRGSSRYEHVQEHSYLVKQANKLEVQLPVVRSRGLRSAMKQVGCH